MTEPLVYEQRDTCPLPDLIDAQGRVLAPGTTYTCPHRTWHVGHGVQHGGTVQPAWAAVTATTGA